MKTKILDVLNDYYKELMKYLKIIKKKVKKILRKIKHRWNNPKSELGKKIVPKINEILIDIYQGMQIIYSTFKESLLSSENRKRNLTMIGSFIIFNLLLLVFMPSYAVYQNDYMFSVLGSRVGDKYSNQFDYTLLIYIENTDNNGSGDGTYSLTSDIPNLGYTYSGYTCKNDSILLYDSETKNTSVTLEQKDVCSVYFDLTNVADIGIKIMIEDVVDSNSYKVTNNIPYYGYKYSHYECENNSNLSYDSELHTVNVSSGTTDYCNVYFQKEAVDIEIKLFVEETYQTGDYIERLSIPSNNTYTLNESNSSCINSNNERIETEIGYTDGYIEVSTNEAAYCEVYLDKTNE